MDYLHQSTEVARTQETLIQGSWYENLRDDEEGGIAGMFYQGDIATSFWTMSISSTASAASWLNGGYCSGVLTHQRSRVEELKRTIGDPRNDRISVRLLLSSLYTDRRTEYLARTTHLWLNSSALSSRSVQGMSLLPEFPMFVSATAFVLSAGMVENDGP